MDMGSKVLVVDLTNGDHEPSPKPLAQVACIFRKNSEQTFRTVVELSVGSLNVPLPSFLDKVVIAGPTEGPNSGVCSTLKVWMLLPFLRSKVQIKIGR